MTIIMQYKGQRNAGLAGAGGFSRARLHFKVRKRLIRAMLLNSLRKYIIVDVRRKIGQEKYGA